MKEKLTFTTIHFIALFAFGIIDVAYGDSTIIIPIRFHIVTGLSKEKDGLTMES